MPALRGTERGICFMDNGLVEKMLNKSERKNINSITHRVLLLVIAPVKVTKQADMYRAVIHTKT